MQETHGYYFFCVPPYTLFACHLGENLNQLFVNSAPWNGTISEAI